MGNALAFYEPKRAWGGALNPAHPNVYTDGRLFREEQHKVFSGSWLPACHEGEIPNAYDYCTFSHPAGPYLFVIRGRDRKVRSFHNLCPRHGTSLLPGPSGTARRIACGGLLETSNRHCVDITRVLDAARKVRGAQEIEPREVRTSVGYGGFAWVNLDYEGPSLKDSMGDAMRVLEPYLNRPLKVFLRQRMNVNTNYRLWRETNPNSIWATTTIRIGFAGCSNPRIATCITRPIPMAMGPSARRRRNMLPQVSSAVFGLVLPRPPGYWLTCSRA